MTTIIKFILCIFLSNVHCAIILQRAILKPLLAPLSSVIFALNVDVNNLDVQKPTDQDNQLVQMAFRDFDLKRFDSSEKEFTMSIKKWNDLHRPRDEVVSLLKARANVRLDNKKFEDSIQDYNQCLELMKPDGEDDQGRGRYPEYPDTYVGRALAKEGLADWNGALEDYDKAISLWGGRKASESRETTERNTDGINPYVLTFRGNVLTRLNDYDRALLDYEDASDIFIANRDIDRYSDARANYALALYQLGREDDSIKVMKDVTRKNPAYADMYVALAAHDWSKGNYIGALKNWQFTCDRIEVGCDAYKDLNWVKNIRRWPPKLTTKLSQFLTREIPDELKGNPGDKLAPKS